MGEHRRSGRERAVPDGGTTTTAATAEEEADVGGLSAPSEDQEMPLADHIEEMIKRLAIVIVVAGSVSIVVFPLADQLITFIWYSVLPGGDVAQPRVYGPLEFVLARIKVASLAGLIVALPVMVYETYRFMRPGLYRNERKYYLAAVPTSLILAIVGVLFAFFVVLPAIFTYFLTYSQDAGAIAFGLGDTFGLMLILMGYLAIVFQIPLLIMLAIMMGLTTRRWLTERRLYFWGAFLGVAFVSSPDPTGMAPIIVALTMVGLFEGTLLILRWVGR
ncbi:twin-arginine translocase subunit TatC [Halalkalicoccus jeotgali]|uniref:Sec-independent protein translocase protein TatC n=1 Tax=Halalkalicoccus jeotgali (strain DSM 18796 / CECT 7217 / JCM 14584 / KCTC 4019 / B3) TaxID=795797 RepID=D8J5Y4_HALJB|nr:twin-arginine translocase subunit TatC [Halalkalicoccus jeotgali]ADJ13790.1 sec-independent protein translocase component TatC 1 [Halalkalicoccus jeotgali B3]ELY34164.1 sec-independent protein translocase component TatC 1 [Halalkalicoccus jeotgali B3]